MDTVFLHYACEDVQYRTISGTLLHIYEQLRVAILPKTIPLQHIML